MDSGRKDFTDKASEKLTPDTSKSTLDKTKETVTGAGDKAARDAVPDSQKSTTQAVGDHASRVKDAHKTDDASVLDKAKAAVGMDKK